ncbi:RagB/SusD family nutrient uptake outer membrane protein [Marinoscillum sp. 108]|uniref:RagB/SusD family nutrient uptake outer membrane protein n=1 Tax=Marinoscillum sp. 108 TaxID=2653151 RepID=UPI0012F4555E|nr:RagB/SusD family nutrient uptake outer membrane protein [Marinoscillum sp. 108]VXD14274.1 RagB/SusD family nutrient uptake outer membrane protein [Marinoscillum sp. 108]
MKRFYILLISLSILTACELDQLPSDGIVNESLASNYEGLVAATNGNYAMLKKLIVYDNKEYTANYWVRNDHQLSEFPSDNVMISGSTTDPLFYAFTREHIATMENTSYVWFSSYRAINGCNQIIGAVDESSSDNFRQLLGENYFLRGLLHLSLLKLFALPYSHGVDNPGIILKTSLADEPTEARSTVGQCYAQVEADLLKAEELMSGGRGSAYASEGAAQALLSRVYLHMEQWQDAIDYADKVIDGDDFSLVSRADYLNSFWNGSESEEAIFLVAHLLQDDHASASIGSMYLTDQGQGWGEVYASEPLRDFLLQYPDDIRNDFIVPDLEPDGVTVKERNGFPKYFITKFSYQDGVVTLNSPQLIRLGEVYLNRAEAYAHLNNAAQAIADVNVIRERAGLTGTALYTTTDLKGFASALEVVLHERRLELAWEGFRLTDLVRNKMNIDRSYPGMHLDEGQTTQVIPWDDPRNIYFIPSNEIANNPLIKQNP